MSYYSSSRSYVYTNEGGKVKKQLSAYIFDGEKKYSVGMEQNIDSDGKKEEKFMRSVKENELRKKTWGESINESPWNVSEKIIHGVKGKEKHKEIRFDEPYERYSNPFKKFSNNQLRHNDLGQIYYDSDRQNPLLQ